MPLRILPFHSHILLFALGRLEARGKSCKDIYELNCVPSEPWANPIPCSAAKNISMRPLPAPRYQD